MNWSDVIVIIPGNWKLQPFFAVQYLNSSTTVNKILIKSLFKEEYLLYMKFKKIRGLNN